MKTEDKFDLPQGTLDLLIMRVVALGPIHGYALAQRIQQMSREALQVQQGSLYPALHRLEYKKFLKAQLESQSETGREAKFYELTAQGARASQGRDRELEAPHRCRRPHSQGNTGGNLMSWLQRLFARKRLERDLDKELRFHFETQVADKVRSGISEVEARRLTRLEFGGIEQIKEDCRESRGTMWLESLVQDRPLRVCDNFENHPASPSSPSSP